MTGSARVKQLSCDWCGRDGVTTRLSASGGEIACARGKGCAQRLPHEQRAYNRKRERGQAGPTPKFEYLLEGHWYTLRELADLAAVSNSVIDFRIRKNWPMADVVDRQKLGPEQSYENKKRATSLLWNRRKDVAA